MSSPPIVQYASRTDVGMRRAANQDSQAVRMCTDYDEWSRCGHLFVVADGMGGHAVGDLASRIAVDTLPHAYFKRDADTIETRLRSAILAANKAINDRGRENREFEGMGTTCSVLSLSERGALVGHVGDSRVYRIRRGQIEQLTFDHSLQWEMIRIGRATAENVELFHPRNVITRCLGPDAQVQVDVEGPFSVEAGDFFLLCSDGLTNHVTDVEIGQIVASLPPSESSRLLINLANCRGGSDNCTVVVVAVDSYPSVTDDPPEVKSPPPAIAEVPSAAPVAHSSPALILSRLAAIGCLFAGIGLGLTNKLQAAAALVAAAIVAWLISQKLSGTLNRMSAIDSKGRLPSTADDPSPLAKGGSLPETVTDESSSRSSFRAQSPYRVLISRLSDSLLSNLAEVQSQLVQAARDSGWKVDFEELTNLNRQSALAQQNNKQDKALKTRAKAIDMLMKELYQRSRAAV
jgi:serine/threonine protein phosphatase PrpC